MRTSAWSPVLFAALSFAAIACGAPPAAAPEAPAAPAAARATRPEAADLVDLELVADVSRVGASQELRVGARLAVADGWRVLWTNPGERGTATAVELRGPDGFAIGAPRFPGPERFDAGDGLVDYGYQGDLLIPVTVIAPDELGDAQLEFHADVSFVACRDTCVPGQRQHTLSLEPAAADAPSQPANVALFASAEARMPASLGDEASLDWSDRSVVVTFAGAERVAYFPATGEALVGQAAVPTEDGSALHLSYDGAPAPRGVIAVTRGGDTSYYQDELRPPR